VNTQPYLPRWEKSTIDVSLHEDRKHNTYEGKCGKLAVQSDTLSYSLCKYAIDSLP
jgi:tellurite resistance-related uncharacterized protein